VHGDVHGRASVHDVAATIFMPGWMGRVVAGALHAVGRVATNGAVSAIGDVDDGGHHIGLG